jgi:beta-mannosidase
VGYETIDEYLLRDYNKPKDFESYGYVSQVLQAEGIRTAIEAHRRAKPYCMGTLYWQLNDCWPAVSWSSRDYYGHDKALNYFIKNEYATCLVSTVIKDAMVQIYVVSDSLEEFEAKLHLQLMDFHGLTGFDTTLTIMVQPNSSASIGAVPLDVLLRDKDMKGIKDTKEVVFYTELKLGRRILSRNTLYFEPVKNLHLEKPLIKKSIRATADGYSISLSADRLAKNVYLSVDQKGAFSDNFFDLMPGEVHTISFVTTLRSDTFEDKLKIMTLADTY